MERLLKTYSEEIHAPATKKFNKRSVKVNKANELWSADLVEMGTLKEYNDGYIYLLNVIDVFSRRVWSFPLKDKKANTILTKFKSIGKTPSLLWVDKGSEFYNTKMQQWNKTNDIKMYSTFGENKAVFIERFNRTLKTIMWKEFTRSQSYRWIDKLKDFIEQYNDKIHSSTKTTPIQAYRSGKTQEKKKPFKEMNEPLFKIGDYTRISRVKETFEKGFTYKWSREVFKVIRVDTRANPVMYHVEDMMGETITGGFYEAELRESKMANFGLVEKVIRTRNKKKEHLVKWVGYPEKFNEWVSSERLQRVR